MDNLYPLEAGMRPTPQGSRGGVERTDCLNDVLARHGGDEFAALLPDYSLHDAEIVAGRLRAAMPPQATCSIGIAMWDGKESEDALLTRVDEALYRANARAATASQRPS